VGIEALIGSISKDATTWLRSKYLSHDFIKNCIDEKPTKLYLSRNFFPHPKKEYARTVSNEEKEVWPYLESIGYTFVRGDESIIELIKLFHNASEIVFPHGSMAHFLIFCNRNPKIIEFCSKNRYRECFLNSAMNSQITPRSNYKLILSESDQYNNILIDMAILKSNVF
jgi:capsular polysaccharide biosynthesis protein